MKNLIQIQQEYMDTVTAAIDRWSHTRSHGHSERTRRAAFNKAYRALTKWGYTNEQARYTIRQAHDMMMLERAAVDDPLNHAH